jgi:REP element-mobilizing transposase RayT
MNQADIQIHIYNNAHQKGIWIDRIHAYVDHVHCLISLDPDQQLSKVIQLIKGESSFWINRNILLNQEFKWADEYYASSISSNALIKVRDYIQNQEIHHKTKSWEQEEKEYQAMITKLLSPFRLDR